MNFIDGEVLLINKPYLWTSFDVVNKIRWHIKRKLKLKKIKVGHAGTLDPLADGLLIICTGKKTKVIESIQNGHKCYSGTIIIGKTTPSYDLETDFDNTYDISHITEKEILETVNSFIGKQLQSPPIFSAKKIDGKRAYLSARSGKDVNIKEHEIEIFDFKVNTERFPEIDFVINCTKGTYIRSIAHDFGKKLNSGSTLISLRRESSGNYHLKNALEVEEIIKLIDEL